MIIAVPFIYFTLFGFLYYRNKRHIDLALIVIAMFAISGFFSILDDYFELRRFESINYQITWFASFSYCAIITLCILPFTMGNLSGKRPLPIRNERLFRKFAFVSFIWFLIFMLFSSSAVLRVLMGDMQELRSVAAEGELDWMVSLPAPIRLVISVGNLLYGCSWIFIYLAFYSITIQKLPQKYFLYFISVSLAGPMYGITGADRSATAYWIIALIAVFFYFKPFMDSEIKHSIQKYTYFLIGIFVFYLAAMTISRFGDRAAGNGGVSGTQGGLIEYLGQTYINFCMYFDNYDPPIKLFSIVFPFTSKYLLGLPAGGTAIQEIMTAITPFYTGVFYTFIGHIMVGVGRGWALFFTAIYVIASFISIPRLTKKKYSNLLDGYIYIALISVILLGIFTHYYAVPNRTISLIIMYILIKQFK